MEILVKGILRRLAYALVVAFSAQALLAQVSANSPNKTDVAKKPPGNCTVSGRVVSAVDGAPLRSARVALIQAHERKHPLVYAATTDDQGRFEIKQIEASRYDLFATHTGYLDQQYKSRGADDDRGAELALVSGQEVTDVVFRMVRAAVVTGKVVDDNGEPMMAVNVSVLHKPTEEEREEGVVRGKKVEMLSDSVGETDDRGEYRVYGLKPGEYYVKAAETGESTGFRGPMTSSDNWMVLHEVGNQYAPLYYPGVLQADQAQAVTLRAGEEMTADFAMRRIKLVEVAGKVIAPDGSPGHSVFVQLGQVGVSDWGGDLGNSTDSQGEFSIKGVPPGSYVVRASMHEKDKFYSTQQRIEVGEEKIGSVVLALGAGATIHGRMITASGAALPSERINVHLQSTDEEGAGGFARAELNKDGSFEISGVTDGNYFLMAGGYGPGWFVKSAHLGNEDVFQNGIHVENGTVKGSLAIVISSDGAEVEGTITDNDNQPLPGVQIRARAEPPTDYNQFRGSGSSTDQNGHFVLKDVPPGKYKLTAKIPSSGGSAPAIKSDPVVVTLGEREHRTLDFRLNIPKSE